MKKLVSAVVTIALFATTACAVAPAEGEQGEPSPSAAHEGATAAGTKNEAFTVHGGRAQAVDVTALPALPRSCPSGDKVSTESQFAACCPSNMALDCTGGSASDCYCCWGTYCQ